MAECGGVRALLTYSYCRARIQANRCKCLISKEKNLVNGDQRGSKNRRVPADGFDTGLASKSASGGHVGLRSVPQAAGHRLPSRLRFPKRGTTRGEAGLLLEVSQHVAELPKCVRPLYAPLRPFTPVPFTPPLYAPEKHKRPCISNHQITSATRAPRAPSPRSPSPPAPPA